MDSKLFLEVLNGALAEIEATGKAEGVFFADDDKIDEKLRKAIAWFKEAKTTVWLLTTGSGTDGDEWYVQSIHATREGAERAKDEYEKPRMRPDKSTYVLEATVEEWPVQE